MTSEEFRERLTARASLVGLSVSSEAAASIEQYYRLLAVWNERMNLTALNLRELPPSAMDRLFVEPLLAARLVSPGAIVLDIGSGGGSPAIPFAIGARASHLTMIESRVRKTVFLREAARVVGLGVDVIGRRAEDAIRDAGFRRRYDVLTVRAVRLEAAIKDQLTRILRIDGQVFMFQSYGAGVHGPYPGLDAPVIHPLTAEAELLVLKRDVPRGTVPTT